MGKCIVQYIIEEGEIWWACPSQVGSRSLRNLKTTEKCWKYNCPGVQLPEMAKCKTSDCKTLPAEGSLYCSAKCRHRSNMRAYRKRKKECTTNQ